MRVLCSPQKLKMGNSLGPKTKKQDGGGDALGPEVAAVGMGKKGE